jgi:hypothetical protein
MKRLYTLRASTESVQLYEPNMLFECQQDPSITRHLVMCMTSLDGRVWDVDVSTSCRPVALPKFLNRPNIDHNTHNLSLDQSAHIK